MACGDKDEAAVRIIWRRRHIDALMPFQEPIPDPLQLFPHHLPPERSSQRLLIHPEQRRRPGTRLLPLLDQLARVLDLVRAELARAAHVLPAPPGCVHPGAGALRDQRPLELSHGPDHVEGETAPGRRGVDGFRQRGEARARLAEPVEKLDQARERAPEAVQLPDHQHVAAADPPERLREAGAGILRARDPLILIDGLAPGRLERMALQVEILLVGGDAGISDLHGWPSSL